MISRPLINYKNVDIKSINFSSINFHSRNRSFSSQHRVKISGRLEMRAERSGEGMFVAVQFQLGLTKLHLVRIKIELLKIFFSRFFFSPSSTVEFLFLYVAFASNNDAMFIFKSFAFNVSEHHVIMKIMLVCLVPGCV